MLKAPRIALLLLMSAIGCRCGLNRHVEGHFTSRPAFIHAEPAPELKLGARKTDARSLLVVNGELTSEPAEAALPVAYRWKPGLFLIADTAEPHRLMLWNSAHRALQVLGRGQFVPVGAEGDLIVGGSLFAAGRPDQSFVLADIDPETYVWREIWHSDQVDPESIELTQDAGTLYVGLARGDLTAKSGGVRETVLAAITPGIAPEVDVIDPKGTLRFVRDFQRGSRSLLIGPVEISGLPPAPSHVFSRAVAYDRSNGSRTKLGAVGGCYVDRASPLHPEKITKQPVVPLEWGGAQTHAVCTPAAWRGALGGVTMCEPVEKTDCPVNTVDESTVSITRGAGKPRAGSPK